MNTSGFRVAMFLTTGRLTTTRSMMHDLVCEATQYMPVHCAAVHAQLYLRHHIHSTPGLGHLRPYFLVVCDHNATP